MAAAAPKCPLCQGDAEGSAFPFGTVWNGRRYDYLRCGRCRSSFISPLPSEDEFRLMYDQSSYHDCYYQCEGEEPTDTALPAIRDRLPSVGRLLDFGCGNGAFLRAARSAGFDCEGVELDEKARAQASANSGCPVRSLAEVMGSGSTFGVIHLGDVLEHLPSPEAVMRELEPLLAKGGIFFIEGPLEDNPSLVLFASRAFGAFKKLAGRSLYGVLPPFHLFRTTARAQRAFFERRLGYQIALFRVHETGWPYRNPGDSLLRPGSAGAFIRQAIGLAAIAAGAALSRTPLRIGNRFVALVEPRRPHDQRSAVISSR